MTDPLTKELCERIESLLQSSGQIGLDSRWLYLHESGITIWGFYGNFEDEWFAGWGRSVTADDILYENKVRDQEVAEFVLLPNLRKLMVLDDLAGL